MMTDHHGELLWERIYGGVSSDGAHAMIQTDDGGFVLVGWTKSYGNGSENFWLVKTNQNGTIQWNQTIESVFSTRAFTIVQTTDDGFVLAGRLVSETRDSDDWFIKTVSPGIKSYVNYYHAITMIMFIGFITIQWFRRRKKE
jgi:hypothetical protein